MDNLAISLEIGGALILHLDSGPCGERLPTVQICLLSHSSIPRSAFFDAPHLQIVLAESRADAADTTMRPVSQCRCDSPLGATFNSSLARVDERTRAGDCPLNWPEKASSYLLSVSTCFSFLVPRDLRQRKALIHGVKYL